MAHTAMRLSLPHVQVRGPTQLTIHKPASGTPESMGICVPHGSRSPIYRVLIAVAAIAPLAHVRAVADDTSETTSAPATKTERENEISYQPVLNIEGGGGAIKEALESASRLFTYKKEPLDSVAVLFARAKEDRPRLLRAMNALGFFGAQVEITVAGYRIDDIAAEDALSADPPKSLSVEIKVIAGPQFTFGRIQIAPADGTSGEAIAKLAADTTGLKTGDKALSAPVVAADARIVSALREAGYPFAAIAKRDAIADHATSKLEITFYVASGPQATFGKVSVRGQRDMDPEFIAKLAPFSQGDPFKASKLTQYKSELERLSVFDAVTIEEGKSLDAQGQLSVTVVVHERPAHVVGLSASLSTLEGTTFGGYWAHRNLWGNAEQLRLEARTARLFLNGTSDYEYALTATLTQPAVPENSDDLILQIGGKRERPDAYERDAAFVDARVRRRFDPKLTGEAGITVVEAHEKDFLGERDRLAIILPATLTSDTRDNLLDATRGLRASITLQPIFNLDFGRAVSLRSDVVLSTYFRLNDEGTTVFAARAAVGMSAAGDLTDLPVDMRFFAGGGGSVRGYEYQALSPRDAAGHLIGGLSKIEGSLELRSWVTDEIGLAAFIDAGSASPTNLPNFDDVGVGVGVGARYKTPIGPVRLDVAFPLDRTPGGPDFAIYVALGQAF